MPGDKTVYIETVGCQMNELDSELVVAALKRQGYRLTDAPADADVLLFNTCSVREHAEEKTYSAIGRVAGFKRADPSKVVGLIGCLAQKDGAAVRRRVPCVDLVVGTGQLAKIPALVEEVRRTREPQVSLSLGRAAGGRAEVEATFESYDPARDPEMRPTPFRAYVRVQIGCDKFCTYCVVPGTRGPEQSRHPDHVLQEVRVLAAQGVKEITFLGQTVNSYAHRHGDGRTTRLSDLLEQAHGVPGVERLRFVTNFPKDMSDDLLAAVRDLPKVVKYLHVPAQSGCDAVLKRMKRHYTVGEYREMLAKCRERVPGVAVSSDFIVGFCGETDASFERTVELTREARFKNSFIFKYSERPGTKAAGRFPDDVPEETKRRRNAELLAVQDANSAADHQAWVGKAVEVLVEGPSRDARRGKAGHAGQLTGHTMTDHICVFDGPPALAGRTLTVDVAAAGGFTLFGTVRNLEAVAACAPIAAVPRRRELNLV